LARPGGNITGLSNLSNDLVSKRLELLRETVPNLHRVGLMANAGNPASVQEMEEVHEAARKLGLDIAPFEVRRAEDIAPAFEALGARVQALYVTLDGLLLSNRIRISTLAVGARLPTMHGSRDSVEAGGLMSYGPNLPDLWWRAAEFVDRILRGTKPRDLPVEQPTKFELVINLTTAKALGVTVPQSLLYTAEVIE
jgi:putative ABC transport system substrate-binding protein